MRWRPGHLAARFLARAVKGSRVRPVILRLGFWRAKRAWITAPPWLPVAPVTRTCWVVPFKTCSSSLLFVLFANASSLSEWDLIVEGFLLEDVIARYWTRPAVPYHGLYIHNGDIVGLSSASPSNLNTMLYRKGQVTVE